MTRLRLNLFKFAFQIRDIYLLTFALCLTSSILIKIIVIITAFFINFAISITVFVTARAFFTHFYVLL